MTRTLGKGRELTQTEMVPPITRMNIMSANAKIRWETGNSHRRTWVLENQADKVRAEDGSGMF